jgi:hypothetical protein
MREFQEKNGIQKQCVTNCQYLYDVIKLNGNHNVKVKAVIVISDMDTLGIISHLVVVNNNTLLEPSYDVFSLQNKSYFDNTKDFMERFDNEFKQVAQLNLKESIGNFLALMKLADRINDGELVITDKEFYDRQADFIESKWNARSYVV